MVITDMVTNWSVQKKNSFLYNWFQFIGPTSGHGGKFTTNECSSVISSENSVFFVYQLSLSGKLITVQTLTTTTNTHPPPSSLSRSLKDAVLYEAWKGLSEKEREQFFLSLLFPVEGFLIRCLSLLNLLMGTMTLPGTPVIISGLFHHNHGDSSS